MTDGPPRITPLPRRVTPSRPYHACPTTRPQPDGSACRPAPSRGVPGPPAPGRGPFRAALDQLQGPIRVDCALALYGVRRRPKRGSAPREQEPAPKRWAARCGLLGM